MSRGAGRAAARLLWRSVAALAIAETVSWGVLFYSFGVLLPAMESELHLSRTVLTAVFSGALLVGSVVAGTEEEILAEFRRVRDEMRRVFDAYAAGLRDGARP